MKHHITPGTKVKIVNVHKNDIGFYDIYALFDGIGTVAYHQDCPNKIKVNFDEKWQGYFCPTQLQPINECNSNKHLIKIMKKAITMDENEKKNIYKRIDNLEKEIKELKQMVVKENHDDDDRWIFIYYNKKEKKYTELHNWGIFDGPESLKKYIREHYPENYPYGKWYAKNLKTEQIIKLKHIWG